MILRTEKKNGYKCPKEALSCPFIQTNTNISFLEKV